MDIWIWIESYRFQSILQQEVSASGTTAAGKDEVRRLPAGDKRSPPSLGIKKPDLLCSRTGKPVRPGCLSPGFEIQTHFSDPGTTSGEVKMRTTRLVDGEYNPITQQAYDAKVILIIGSWDQVDNSNERKASKRSSGERLN